MPQTHHSSSFRDPSGFVFVQNGVLYRQVNRSFSAEWQRLKSSAFYRELITAGWLVEAPEVSLELAASEEAVAVLQPAIINPITYPYEWCFSELKDAALLTLDIAILAVKNGFALKDASAFNIQFHEGKPIFIDTLSFEQYEEGAPWIAYKQFCQHFLAPLALMSFVDIRLLCLFRSNLDGIPLDLASDLLPGKTKLKAGIVTHLHLHAKAQTLTGKSSPDRRIRVSKTALLALFDNLHSTIQSLNWRPTGTEWANYYAFTNYTDSAMEHKRQIVAEMIDEVRNSCTTAIDLGANNGAFSSLCAERGFKTIACDIDPAAVERAYLACKKSQQIKVLPLLMDLTNPSPAVGWNLHERDSFFDRFQSDLVLALALIHHLVIGNNTPLPMVFELFARLGRFVIVEWVPKEDSQVQKMMRARKDIFETYHLDTFRKSLANRFEIIRETQIAETERILFCLRRID